MLSILEQRYILAVTTETKTNTDSVNTQTSVRKHSSHWSTVCVLIFHLSWSGEVFHAPLKNRHIALASTSARPNDGMRRGQKRENMNVAGSVKWKTDCEILFTLSAAGLKQNTQYVESIILSEATAKNKNTNNGNFSSVFLYFCSGEWATLNRRCLMSASSDHILHVSRLDFAMQMWQRGAEKNKEERLQPAEIE